MKYNFVAKNMRKFNRPSTHKNSVREMRLGKDNFEQNLYDIKNPAKFDINPQEIVEDYDDYEIE